MVDFFQLIFSKPKELISETFCKPIVLQIFYKYMFLTCANKEVIQSEYNFTHATAFGPMWCEQICDLIGSLKLDLELKEYSHYHQTSKISRTLVGNKLVDHSDVVGAAPVGTTPTTSSFST